MATPGSDPPSLNPLAFTAPSPIFVLRYPIMVGSVRLLCEQHGKTKQQASFTQLLGAVRLRYREDGFPGLYHGAHIFFLHQSTRELLRFLASRALEASPLSLKAEVEDGEDKMASWKRLGWRLATKYLIDAVCYPLLLCWTRGIVLRDNAAGSWQQVCTWCREEGPLTLFSGLTASLAHAACEDAADIGLQWCIEQSCGEVGALDRLMLKQCAAQVVSVFTDPFDYVGVIRRCQSDLPGLLPPRPLWSILLNLPWRSSLFQLLAYSGLLGLAFKMIQMKQEYDDYENTVGKKDE